MMNRRRDSIPITAQQINELIVKTQNELKGTSIVVTHDIHSALFHRRPARLAPRWTDRSMSRAEDIFENRRPDHQFLKRNLYKLEGDLR